MSTSFEAKYASVDDPWSFQTSPYEQERYETLLRALSRRHYGVIYEPGCSIGVLTAKLAAIADCVIATDVAPTAVARARALCRSLANVELSCGDVRTFQPTMAPELIVFSEIGYYFDAAELARIGSRLASTLLPDGEFIAAHWLGRSADHVLHGDEVHGTLKALLPLRWVTGERHAGFRIDRWVKL